MNEKRPYVSCHDYEGVTKINWNFFNHSTLTSQSKQLSVSQQALSRSQWEFGVRPVPLCKTHSLEKLH